MPMRGDIKLTFHFAWWPTVMTNGRKVWLQYYTRFWEYERSYDPENSQRTFLSWQNPLTLKGKRDEWDFS